MVKSVLGVNHRGLRDWVIQRLTAVLMAVYATSMLLYITCSSEITFAAWHGLFSETWMKVVTLMFVLSVLFHAWVGIWTVLTDYVKNFIVGCVLHAGVFLILSACFFWALLILWSV